MVSAALWVVQAATAQPALDTPARTVDFAHMRLELRLTDEDMAQKQMSGVVTYRVRPRAGVASAGLETLPLNAVGLEIQMVEELGSPRPAPAASQPGGAEGEPADRPRPAHLLRFTLRDPDLAIRLAEPHPKAGEEFTVRITYRAKAQGKGLYFVLPDDDHPDRPRVVYTMSEPLMARYWLPCHDWPDTRWPSDFFITVPEPLSVVTNGVPVGEPQSDAAGLRTFHWRMDIPVDPHLVGFAAGEFVTVPDTWRGRPVLAYVPPGREAEARFTFRRVPEVLEYYSKLVGYDYPFPRYAHVAVTEHFHGGMEHAGFSMIAPSLLTSGPRGNVPEDWAQYNYIAHMLAHQWFAGVVNYRELKEAWVNEGFGTYLHLNWYTQTDSVDGFRDQMDDLIAGLAHADVAGQGRPMVRTDLAGPEEVYNFDGAKVYWKGAWVLHMLRHQLGEDVFWKGVQAYLRRFAGGTVVTDDLERTLGEVSGRDLKPFFDQWVRRGGVPQLAVQYAWDADKRQALVTVQQQQQIDEDNPAFAFPLDLWFSVAGKWEKKTADVKSKEQRVEFSFDSSPEIVCLDPLGGLLATRKEEKSADLWRKQARAGPTALARSEAVEHLGAQHDEAALPVLADALLDGREYWGTRARAARALQQYDAPAAGEALVRAAQMNELRPELLVALIHALGRYASSEAAYRAVRERLSGDAPIVVREAAVRTLPRFKRELLEPADIERLAKAARPPKSRFVRSAALDALKQINNPAALDPLVAEAKAEPGDTLELRRETIDVVVHLAGADSGHRPGACAYLFAQVADPRPGVRVAALRGLGAVGDNDTIPRLRELVSDADHRVQSAAKQAIEAIKKRTSPESP